MQHKTFEQWIQDETKIEAEGQRKYDSQQAALYAALKRAWDFQRELAQPMADQWDALSRACGKLPAPAFVAVNDWKGEEVPDDIRLQADQYEQRLRDAMMASSADPGLGSAQVDATAAAADPAAPRADAPPTDAGPADPTPA